MVSKKTHLRLLSGIVARRFLVVIGFVPTDNDSPTPSTPVVGAAGVRDDCISAAAAASASRHMLMHVLAISFSLLPIKFLPPLKLNIFTITT